MKRMEGLLWVAACVSVFLLPAKARAWGSYGHEQVNSAALHLLAGKSYGGCLSQNENLIVRYAETPDMDWKAIGRLPDDPALRRLTVQADHYEHPLHFFEADAFAGGESTSLSSIQALPSDEAFLKDLSSLTQRLAAEASYVAQVDPSKKLADPAHPTPAEVEAHGTAPWRAKQLFDLGVAALKKNDFPHALLYLSAMGHYIGDMSQPFHATLNFDGDFYDSPAAGIHHTFEEAILEDQAKAKGASLDEPTYLWSSFGATEGEVSKIAQQEYFASSPLASDKFVPEVLGLVSTGYPYVELLLGSFAQICKEGPDLDRNGNLKSGGDGAVAFARARANRHLSSTSTPAAIGNSPRIARGMLRTVTASRGSIQVTTPIPSAQLDHGTVLTEEENAPFCVAVEKDDKSVAARVSVGMVRAFTRSQVEDPKQGIAKTTVLEVAEQRLAKSAVLLARIWDLAFETAKPDLTACPKLSFDKALVLQNYPKPSYLRAGP